MSVTVTTDVFCDSCACWANFSSESKAQVRGAIEAARKDGWTIKRRELICPKCNGKKQDYWESWHALPRVLSI